MMRLLCVLILLALLQPPPDPHLVARWDGPDSATVSWSQESRGCLYRNQTFVGCYEAPGVYNMTFGRVGPLDGAYRPSAGDVYQLQTGGVVYRAPLQSVVYLAAWRA